MLLAFSFFPFWHLPNEPAPETLAAFNLYRSATNPALAPSRNRRFFGGMENSGDVSASVNFGRDYSQPFSAMNSNMRRASGLPFLEAATSSTRAWSQFFSTPSPRRYKSASVTSAGT